MCRGDRETVTIDHWSPDLFLAESSGPTVSVSGHGPAMNLGILGPVEVRLDDGEPLALGGFRQRALLAILVLHANEVVSTDRLVDELWMEHPPVTARHTVQVFVSRLRSALTSAGERLVTRPPGYVLEVGVNEIDADRCEQFYAEGRAALAAADAARAAELLRDAEALWRGPPVAEFTYEPFAQATIARLEELRVGCREELIEAELALGRQAEVVADLEALVREHPFRERPRGQLMLALYRCGRQADALDAFQQTRHTLVEELAVEPSSALRELEQAILRQDPSLAAPSAPAPAPAFPEAASVSEAREAPYQSATPTPVIAPGSFASTVRKTATVLVVRLSTTSHTDPEVARRLIAAARAEVERIVTHHGGTFVSGLGGEVVGLFGLPLTKEDDTLRAVRAADELRGRVAAGDSREPGGLLVCIGLDTGEVVADALDDVFGEPLGGAAGFALVAQHGQVLLSDVTRRLASDAVRVESMLDGAAWRLLDLITEAPDFEPGLGTPMVGRDDELAAAGRAFAHLARTGEAHMLTVIGDAGIGKSRFAQALVDQHGDQATVLAGRCLSYGAGIALWPIREAVTQAAGGESREAIRGLLGRAEDAELVADIIAATLGLGPPDSFGEQVSWAFRRMFEELARDCPVIMLIEDAHWAEPPLLDLVEYLFDWLTAPVMLVCLARPEPVDVSQRWGRAHVRVTPIALGPLADEDVQRLLGDQLGERSLSAAERAQILEAAEGNALFAEQLLEMNTKDPAWDRERKIPPTIQSLLAARLDRLGPGERAFMERAALIGRTFWPGAVLELLPAEAQSSANQHLRALVRLGLIQPDRSTVAGEDELRFRHILIRDVAYHSTPKTLRSELHERFADWLARHGEAYDEFVGYHLEQAFGYRSELGRADLDALALAARAAEHLAAAGRRALSRGDTNATIKLLTRSADLFEAGGSVRPDVLLDLGSALSESGDFSDAEPVLTAALEQAQATQSEALSARALIELSYWRSRVDETARAGEMLPVAERAIAVFNRVGDESGLSRAWLHIAWVHWIRSQCAEMEPALERALQHAGRAGERREEARILSDLARATVIGPRPIDDGISRCTAILERASGDITSTAFTEAMLAVLEAMDGRFGEARDRWRRSKQRLADVGLNFVVAVVQMYYAFIELMAGSPENAEPEVAEACAVFERIGDRGRLSSSAALLARLLYAQNRHDESYHYSQVSEQTASTDDVVSQVLWRGTRAKVLARAGEALDAEQLVNSSVAQAEATDFLMLHGDALSDRAEVLAILHGHESSARDVMQANALYERKGIRARAPMRS
jgi:DNA-binding SARP family transcriptional activator/class 3 adenylate cyclase